MRHPKGSRKYCVVCVLCRGTIVSPANVVQHTNLEQGHGDGLKYLSGYARREGSDEDGRKPFYKLHGVALSEPQNSGKLPSSILALRTDVC